MRVRVPDVLLVQEALREALHEALHEESRAESRDDHREDRRETARERRRFMKIAASSRTRTRAILRMIGSATLSGASTLPLGFQRTSR